MILLKMLITRAVLALENFRQWLNATLAFSALNLLKLAPADPAIRFADRLARKIGPKTSRHKLMLVNLKRAYPEKSEEERVEIALDSWGNMGRLAAEYVFLDRLFDFDPANPKPGRVEVIGTETFLELRDNPRPFIVFTAHSGNFELLPVAGSAFGLDVTVLFRPPNNPYVAKRIFDFRKERMGNLVPSHAGSSFALARQLEKGGGIGVLVDQKFRKGLPTKFFGNDVLTNPLLAKLVRQFGCDVFPARCVRLPDNRYRLEIEPKVEIPLNENGSVDVQKTAQLLNDKVESWVREYPGQWLWYHDRWHIKNSI
ncbi:lipid A biosynthesis lauroyl acyltransferase [Rhizobium sp. CFBP 13717]|uniref:lipid A biosynthesis lauroyl acyltransferase n=2 Tax=unclassified Rhizobium TaxID=2613769 RepID=UPI00177CBA0E|nr:MULTISPECIES: lipid A biosynthesis lauroyl acyltransferase [unclassified Rhizobium]MBD8689228.1 lipid A biosynthesis lauroyl acyltransferase [Rhizobium sp. CFBP 13644]MBD8693226.1 lipid A biosynthesis lauroyl acyltransferase [Rhizobium sp. CFBP 13717]